MLHLKPKRFSLPQFYSSRELKFAPIPANNDDELIRAIEEDRGEAWELEAAPDTRGLAEFWSGVEQDIASDPDGFKFTDSHE